MRVVVTTRIIFKLPKESEAAKAFEESWNEDIIRNGNAPEMAKIEVTPEGKIFTVMTSREEPIANDAERKSCLSCVYERTHIWNEPCRSCENYRRWWRK